MKYNKANDQAFHLSLKHPDRYVYVVDASYDYRTDQHEYDVVVEGHGFVNEELIVTTYNKGMCC